AIAATTIPVLLSRRKNKSDSAPSPPPSVALPLTPHAAATKSPLTGREGMPISTFTIKEMQEHINAVPLFHREAAEQHYTGLRVRWRAKLDAINPNSTRSSIYAHSEEGYTELSCSSTPAGIASLIHTHQNASILIDGVIKRASAAYCELTDCFIIPDDPANALRDHILEQAIVAKEDTPLMQLKFSKEITDQDIAHQIQLLIEEGLLKGEVLSTTPLAFYITRLTSSGHAYTKRCL